MAHSKKRKKRPMTALFLSSNNNANGKEKGPKSYNGPSTPFRLIPGLENAGVGEPAGNSAPFAELLPIPRQP